MKTKLLLTPLLFVSMAASLMAQSGVNQTYEAKRLSCTLANSAAVKLVNSLSADNLVTYQALTAFLAAGDNSLSTTGNAADLAALKAEISSAFTDKRAGVIFVYRRMVATTNAAGITTFAPDPDQTNTITNSIVFHNVTANSISNYLYETKKLYVVLVDMPDSFYAAGSAADNEKKLSGTSVKINYKKSYFSQSFSDLLTAVRAMGVMGAANEINLGITLVKVDPNKVRTPCDLVLSNPSFKNDLTFNIHESNVASFQIGVANSQLNVKNISISDNNLVVKPSSDQATSWKSDAYALLEIHLPRDVDNFRPLWSSVAHKDGERESRNVWHWLGDNLFERTGLYGGIKIAKDPLSNIYAGFNYAVTKDFAFNFGWVWVNDYATQVTDVGSIGSVNDALKYAKRSYSGGKFSVGISFSPSSFITSLGLNKSASPAIATK
ncbi:hypothetical protein [Mucilaginibacter sp. HD30]